MLDTIVIEQAMRNSRTVLHEERRTGPYPFAKKDIIAE
jgi:hypothetical protein